MSEVLVHVTRGNSIENIHRGNIAVIDRSGKLIAKAGNPYQATFMRSCSKPMQASAVLESGAAEQFGLDDREIAIMCASHYSEDFHVQAVLSILYKIGLDESYLKCGPTYSINEKVTEDYLRKGHTKKSTFNNCSGKHAGMLALALKCGYDVRTYNLLENPVQQRMLKTVAEYAEVDAEDIGLGIDGCGVPVYELPLFNIALAYSKLADTGLLRGKRRAAANKIISSMTRYPEMISGTGGFCTELMKHTNGKLVAKLGADAVYCVGAIGKGIGIAVKIEDGNMKVLSSAVVEVLRQLQLLDDDELKALWQFHIKDNINTLGDKVGEVRPAFTLAFQ